MQFDKYNEWDFLPLSLRPKQVNEPMIVLDHFFDNDSLSGHREILRDWCYTLFKDDYYRNQQGSPSGLFYHHELTVNLVEAAYLLKDSGNRTTASATVAQIQREQGEWSFYPSTLSLNEQLNPYLVFDRFFADYSLPEYREQLHDWLHHGLSSMASREFIEPQDLVRVNDNLQALYTAAWFVFQRTTDKPSHRKRTVDAELNNIVEVSQIQSHPNTIYTLDYKLKEAQSAKMSSIIAIVVHKVNTVDAIIYLGTSPLGQIYLLVLTANNEQRVAQNLAATIEESCREIANVVALVHHASALFTGLRYNNRFFSNALKCPAVYLSGELLLPEALPLSTTADSDFSFLWEHWFGQCNDFLTGAEYHISYGAYNAALFCLQQCAECALMAVVRGVLGYNINNHNLSRLFTISGMFTAEISGVFGTDDAENSKLFKVLKNAYVNVRYKDGYKASGDEVTELSSLVKKLVVVIEQVFLRHKMVNSI